MRRVVGVGLEKVRLYTDGRLTQFVNCRASLCGGLGTDAITSQTLIMMRLQDINVFELPGNDGFASEETLPWCQFLCLTLIRFTLILCLP